ncbi:hypothetical protein GCM10023194_52470 [Planotetraspora phitsanulokensis]|uniref:Uncharacterized protein n=1 Tax=Planotetraspora phitsanulokensis TaxID=575192 RepID=A0A8J3UQ20_9ACTN|nr:hypothetical protein [Planotetraspora phitsanulokensis]GII42585.1 hypothetical protein Pph01_75880 [Planotetraspora phitsanulokensis]
MNPRIAFVAAPLLTMAYGVIRILDGFDGERGPGLAWTIGHLAFLGALAMFVVTFVQMRRMAGRNTLSTVSATIGIIGILSLIAQFVIDMVVGFLSADHAAMGVHFERIQAVPGVLFAVYTVVPLFFFIGQFAIVAQLAVQRRVKAWTPVLVLLDCVVPNLDKDLMPLGALFLLISFIPLAGLASRAAEPVPVAA